MNALKLSIFQRDRKNYPSRTNIKGDSNFTKLKARLIITSLVFLIIAAILFIDGNSKLASLNACLTFRVCMGTPDSNSSAFTLSLLEDRIEVVAGIVLGLIGIGLAIYLYNQAQRKRVEQRKETPPQVRK